MKDKLFRYRVTFKKQRQIDGFTNPAQDLEYDTVRETITVQGKNEEHAKRVACEKAYGWVTYNYPRQVKWYKEDIKSIYRIKKKTLDKTR